MAVESPAACAKRMRKEREERERKERGEGMASGEGVVGQGGRGFGGGTSGQGSGGGEVVGGRGGVGGGRGIVKSSQRRRKGFKGASGLYYLLAAIEFVETS